MPSRFRVTLCARSRQRGRPPPNPNLSNHCSGVNIPDDISNDPLKYEAFLRAKYDEQQWEAAHSNRAAGSGSDGGARPAPGGLLGKVHRPKLPSFKGGRKVEHAPRLVDDAGGNEGAAGASAVNRLLSILDAEINIKL